MSRMSSSSRYFPSENKPIMHQLEANAFFPLFPAQPEQRLRLRSRPLSLRHRRCSQGRPPRQRLCHCRPHLRGYVEMNVFCGDPCPTACGLVPLQMDKAPGPNTNLPDNAGIKAKVDSKGQYDQYLQELKPLREELGVPLKEDLFAAEQK